MSSFSKERERSRYETKPSFEVSPIAGYDDEYVDDEWDESQYTGNEILYTGRYARYTSQPAASSSGGSSFQSTPGSTPSTTLLSSTADSFLSPPLSSPRFRPKCRPSVKDYCKHGNSSWADNSARKAASSHCRNGSVKKVDKDDGKIWKYLLALVFAALLAMTTIVYCRTYAEQFATITFAQKVTFSKCSFERFLTEYPRQHEQIWSNLEQSLQKAIIGSRDRRDYNVYLFVESKSINIPDADKSRDTRTKMTLIKHNQIDHILKHYEQCMGQRLPIVNLDLDLFKSKESLQDYGNILEVFRKKHAESRIMRITSLNMV